MASREDLDKGYECLMGKMHGCRSSNFSIVECSQSGEREIFLANESAVNDDPRNSFAKKCKIPLPGKRKTS